MNHQPDAPKGFLATGIACLIAAIVGGGLKAFGFEFRPIDSLPRQILLGDLGLALILWSHGIRHRVVLALVLIVAVPSAVVALEASDHSPGPERSPSTSAPQPSPVPSDGPSRMPGPPSPGPAASSPQTGPGPAPPGKAFGDDWPALGAELGAPAHGRVDKRGSLDPSDERSRARGSGYYADRYTFTGTKGQQVSLLATSQDFALYLYLFEPIGSKPQEGFGGRSSRLPSGSGFYELPDTGTYTIEVTSYSQQTTGNYTLEMSIP